MLGFALLVVACGGGDAPDPVDDQAGSARSSGELAYADTDDGRSDPDDDPEPDDQAVGQDTGLDPSERFVPPARDDEIELVFEDGALGPAELGTSIDEIARALGPGFEVAPEAAIRVDFPAGYSVAKDGEVLFWVVEEDGVAAVFMSNSPKVGLDSGLRPKLPLADAIALHGEPSLSLGEHGREFISFEDGTGIGLPVAILVAIGEFGGPVGSYAAGAELGAEADGYRLEEANIKELWFLAGDGEGEGAGSGVEPEE